MDQHTSGVQASQPSVGQHGRCSTMPPSCAPETARGSKAAGAAGFGIIIDPVRASLSPDQPSARSKSSSQRYELHNDPPEARSDTPIAAGQATGHTYHHQQEQALHRGHAFDAGLPIGANFTPGYASQVGETASSARPDGTRSVPIPNVQTTVDFSSLMLPPPRESRATTVQRTEAGVSAQGHTLRGTSQVGLGMPDAQTTGTQPAASAYIAAHRQDAPAGPVPNTQPVQGSAPEKRYADHTGAGAAPRSTTVNAMLDVHGTTSRPAANTPGLPQQRPPPSANMPDAGFRPQNPPVPGYASGAQGAAGFAAPHDMPDVPMGNVEGADGFRWPRWSPRPDSPWYDDVPDFPGYWYDEFSDMCEGEPDYPVFNPLWVLYALQNRVWRLEENDGRRNREEWENLDRGYQGGNGQTQQHDGMSVVQYQPIVGQQVMLERSALAGPGSDHSAATPLTRQVASEEDDGDAFIEPRNKHGVIGWTVTGLGGLTVGLVG